MDARNTSDRTLNVPTLGVYGVEPGQSVMEVAGEYAKLLDPEAVAGLLSDVWEPADDEARRWLERDSEPEAQAETDKPAGRAKPKPAAEPAPAETKE